MSLLAVLFDSTLKASVVLLTAFAVVELLQRRSAALRHWVLAVAILCAIAAPVVGLVAPRWNVRVDVWPTPTQLERESGVATATAVQEPSAAALQPQIHTGMGDAPARSDRIRWETMAALVWTGGAALTLLILVAGFARLGWLAATARRVDAGRWVTLVDEIRARIGLRRTVILLQSDRSAVLGTWGVSSPRILLPAIAADWSDDRIRIVLSHELAHIQRGDWALQMAAEVLRAACWFNPLTWIACSRLRQESEHACDDAVLNAGVESSAYAAHLLDLARTLTAGRHTWLPAPAMARPSSLKGRISAMLNASINHSPISRSVRLATVLALLVLTVSIAGYGAQNFYTFSGSVVDSTNRVVPGTTLRVINAASQARHEVKSDSTGRFEFVGLPPGEYALEARQPGFSTFTDTFAVIARNIDRTIELRVGELEETITVVGGSGPRREEQKLQSRSDLERKEAVLAKRREAQERCAGSSVGPVGGKIIPPLRLTNANPQYPEHLRAADIGGVVTMEALIGTDGNVQDVRVVQSPHPDLDQAAVEAVRQWQYTQTFLNCVPIEVRMKVTTNFAVRR
jgi:TonB family protein